jgi:iron complex transport system substrate-binding protein
MNHPFVAADYATRRCPMPPHRFAAALAAVWLISTGPGCAASANSPSHAPATRIVSLSPHITELFFAVGAGGRLIGADSFSNYPPEAKRIERVADVFAIDVERLIALKPDLVVYWKSGTPRRQQEQLQSLGLNLYGTEQRSLADIEAALIEFGRLGGTRDQARTAAASFHADLQRLRDRYSGRDTLKVFYQVWDRPLYTLTGAHVVSEVLTLCGATNVFSDLKGLAPVVDTESVLARNPDVIIVAAIGAEGVRQARAWSRFSDLNAARTKRIYLIEPDLLNRMTPRILQGVEQLCKTLDQARLRSAAALDDLPRADLRAASRSSVARR